MPKTVTMNIIFIYMTMIAMPSSLDLNLIALFVLLACGIFSHNSSVTLASVALIIVKITPLSMYFPFIQNHALNLGITILTIGMLAPIASGTIAGDTLLKSFASYKSILAIIIGVFVAWLGSRGVKLMTTQPDVVAGLLIGTVAGVALLRGVPVGPLIAAGILSLFIHKG